MSQNDIAAVSKPYNYKYSVVISAAGTGSRMKSYGAKSLIDIEPNRKIIDLQIESICAYLVNPQIILVAGHEYAKVEAYLKNKYRHVKIVKNDEYAYSNVGHSISIGLQNCKYNRVILMNGDLVFNVKTLSVPIGRESMLLIDPNNTMKEEEVGCTIDKNYVEHVMYDLPNKWAQIAYLCGNELKLLHQICKSGKTRNDFAFQLVNKILDRGGKFKSVSHRDSKIIDIDSSKDLGKIKDIL